MSNPYKITYFTLIIATFLLIILTTIILPTHPLNNQAPLEVKTIRQDAYGFNQTGMEILVRVGDKFSGALKEKGWQDGQIVDIRPLGFYTGKLIRQHFALIELSNIDYWTERGTTDWKSLSLLKPYLLTDEKTERKRDYFIDFRWLLDNEYITQAQYFDIYNRNEVHTRISLDFTDVRTISKHEDNSVRLARLEDTRITTKLKKIAQKIIPTSHALVATGTFSIGSGLDYDTVTAFEADIAAQLTGNLTGEHNDEETTISTDVLFDTDTNGFLLKLTATSGSEHNGTFGSDTWTSGDGARVTYTSADSLTLDETTDGHLDDVEISNLVLDVRGSANDGIILKDGGNGGELIINRNIIRGDSNADTGILISGTSEPRNIKIRNNIIYDFSAASAGNAGIFIDGAIKASFTGNNISNNTIINCFFGWNQLDTIFDASSVLVVKNNLFQANGTDYNLADATPPAAWVTAFNVTEDNTSPDTGYDTKDVHTNSVFQNFGADDFRLDSDGDATNLAILDDGEDLSGTFTDDVEGQTRSTWYIGASEIVAAVVAAVASTFNRYNETITISNIKAEDITETVATIAWNTNRPSHSEVSYGERYPKNIEIDHTLTTNHKITLTNLYSNTLYHYSVGSKSPRSRLTTDPVGHTFTTKSFPDYTPPSMPTYLTLRTLSPYIINLYWNTSRDNVKVAGYNIYRDNTLIASTTVNNYQDTKLTPATQYYYHIQSFDTSSNTSATTSSKETSTMRGPQRKIYCTQGSCAKKDNAEKTNLNQRQSNAIINLLRVFGVKEEVIEKLWEWLGRG